MSTKKRVLVIIAAMLLCVLMLFVTTTLVVCTALAIKIIVFGVLAEEWVKTFIAAIILQISVWVLFNIYHEVYEIAVK